MFQEKPISLDFEIVPIDVLLNMIFNDICRLEADPLLWDESRVAWSDRGAAFWTTQEKNGSNPG